MRKFQFFIILFILTTFNSTFGHGGGDEAGGNAGPNKGVKEITSDLGMTLGKEAIKRLGLKTIRLVGNSSWILPKESLVYSKEEKIIYRVRDEKFKSVLVKVFNQKNENVRVESDELKNGDHVVILGAELLRISELDAGGSSEEEHHEEEEHGHDK